MNENIQFIVPSLLLNLAGN